MSLHRSVPSLAMLQAFEAFGREGGVRKAAQALSVNHSIVSRHLRSLEEFLGTSLIDRSTPDQRLTSDGIAYHREVSAALRSIAHASDLLRRRESRHLVIWCVPGLAYSWLTRLLPRFHALHPHIELEVRPSDRAVDFSLNEADADLRYIRIGKEAEISDTVRHLEIARPEVVPVASPSVADAVRHEVQSVADLLNAPLLHEDDDSEWRLWLTKTGVEPGSGRLPGPRLWHAHLMLEAARLGHGIALANPLILGSDLSDGKLARIDVPGLTQGHVLGGYNLLARRDRWSNKSLSLFRSWLVKQLL